MKKALCIILTLVLMLSASIPAFAANGRMKKLPAFSADSFDNNGMIAVPDGRSETVDWDVVRAAIKTALIENEPSVNLYQYQIPYSEEDTSNYDYIRDYIFNEPRLLRICGRISGGHNITDATGTYIYDMTFSNYAYNAEQYYAMTAVCEDAVTQILYGIKGNAALSDMEKCLLIHDRLAAWCGYDKANNIAGTVPEESHSAYGALGLHVAVCQGYAMAYSWMLDELGIENYYISSDSINHGWNMIYLDNAPYFVDVTWDDSTWDFYGRVRHSNYLQSYNTFSANHQATDFTDEPVSTLYENADWITGCAEIQLIDGKLYYLDSSDYIHDKTFSGTPRPAMDQADLKCLDTATGTVTTLKTFSGIGNQYSEVFIPGRGKILSNVNTRLASIGGRLFYSTATEIRVYDTRTGTDESFYAPDFTQYETGSKIYGFTQRNGTFYVSVSSTVSVSNTEGNTGTVETIPCCEHADKVTLETLAPATCSAGGTVKYICADCRALGTEATAPDPSQHVFGEWTTVAAATCAAEGTERRDCANCDAFETRTTAVDPANHVNTEERDAVAATCTGKGREAGVYCNDCRQYVSGGVEIPVDTTAHDFGGWTTYIAAACTSQGEERRECSRCDAFETRPTAVDPSFHVNTEEREKIPATCTGKGHEAGVYCLDCQRYISGGEEIAPDNTAHDYGEWTAASAATCSAKGTERRDCSRCDAFETRETGLNPANHVNTVEKAAVAATCVATGREAGVYCLACEQYISGGAETSVNPAAHDYGAWTTGVAATCTATGTERRDCTLCDAFETRETAVDPANHVNTVEKAAVAATCTEKGREAGTYCNDCRQFVSGGAETPVDAAAHDYGAWTPGVAATCTVKGTERRECSRCDAFETRETAVDPANHVNTEEKAAVTATCTVAGREAGVYCLDCRQYVSGGAELGLDTDNHVNTEEKAAVMATCTVAGREAGTYCNDCKKFISGGAALGLDADNHVNTEEKAAVAATCTAAGREAGVYCNDCRQYISGGAEIGKLPHDYVAVVTKPTCTKGGYTTYTCANCTDSYTADRTAALGHVDADGDQRCDRCNADLSPEANCTCACHKGGFAGFIFKIKVFFWKLFGMNQYRYCDCGKAHW